MRAARVLNVETDTAYTLRVSQQPASLGRGARIGQHWAENMLITMGKVPWRMAYHRGYLLTYFGRYQLPDSSIAGSHKQMINRGAGYGTTGWWDLRPCGNNV